MSTKSPASGPTGAQRPRHSSLPRYSSSAGREAVDLAREAGLYLDDWQAYVLEHSLGERSDGRWAAGEVGLIVPRQNGKGSILEARELAGLFLFGEKLIMHSAHEFKTAAEGFRRVLALIEANPSFRKRVARVSNAHGAEGIELKTGARLRFVARSKGSGRGFSGDCVILDEAYAMSDAAMDAIMSTLSARPNPQLWYTSSAPLPDSGVLRRVCFRGRAGDDERLAYFEWCADQDDPSESRAAWARANPSLGIRLTEEFTERELAALSPEGFRRERLGVWLEEERASVIPAAAWAALADPASAIVGDVVFAADVSPSRSTAAIAVAGARKDGVPHVEIVDSRPEAWWVADRVLALRERWGVDVPVVVDEAGAAGAVVRVLRDAGVNVIVPTARQVAAAAGRFYDACAPASAALRHRDQVALTAAVDAAVTRPLGDAWTWDRRKPSADITPLVAATLALWGHGEGAAGFDIADQVF